jgi:hypothetical protein
MNREEIDALADRIALAAARIAAATHPLLVDIQRFDSHGGWAAQGATSCAHWLSWRVGLGLVAAREHVRVARVLASLPLISAAMQRGELSYTKVRAMTRVAHAGNEQLLLDMAKGATGSQLERVCGKFRTLVRPRHDEERRFVSRRRMPDGTVRIELRLLPDEAERVWKALQAIREELREPAPTIIPDDVETGGVKSQDLPREDDSAESVIDVASRSSDSAEAPHPASSAGRDALQPSADKPDLADAAVAMAERALVPSAREDGKRRRARAEPFQLFVHLREERLACTELGWQAELHDGTALEGDTLLRLACDCGLVVAKTNARGNVLDIGRKRRSIPPALHRALLLRDRGCRFPGCTATAFVEAHHIDHWLHHGPTSLANTLLVCHHHHVAVHEGGFRIERSTEGEARFLDALGRCIPHAPPPTPVDGASAALPERAHVHRKALLPAWNGGGLDLAAAVGALFFRESLPDPSAALE